MSEVYRYEFDENGVCYRKPDGPFVSHDDYAAIHYERIHDLNQIGGLQEENARLRIVEADTKSFRRIEEASGSLALERADAPQYFEERDVVAIR